MTIELQGTQGNAFVILATASKVGKELGLSVDNILEEMKSGDYIHLVNTFIKHFGDFVQVLDNGEEVNFYQGNNAVYHPTSY